ncbi:MAG: hypothetical protein AAGH57_07950 [Pseudomonadota bacterium]
MIGGAALAMLALVPLVAGTSRDGGAGNDTIEVTLCNGGSITMDLGREDDHSQGDCHQVGCHAGAAREKGRSKTKPSA